MNNKYFASVVTKNDDSTEFVINKGSEHGVMKGFRFLIVELGKEIIDPETGDNLGVLEIVKGEAVVHHIQESMTTLVSNEYLTLPAKEEIKIEPENSFNSLFARSIVRNAYGNKKSNEVRIITESQNVIKPLRGVKSGDKVKLISKR